MSKHLKNTKHDYLRYANCWEDADVLLEALSINENDEVLSIGSAGDNTFSILSQNPKCVVAVDLNLPQLHLIDLKKAAFQVFDHATFLKFLGFHHCESRLDLYSQLLEHLSEDAKHFWNQNAELIQNGVIYSGKFERYFETFRRKVLPYIHPKKRVQELFREKTESEQNSFFDKKWNSLRWRLLFKIFFSKFVMGRLGRDPAFLKQVDVNVSDFILSQSKNCIRNKKVQENYFLEFILAGEFNIGLPHYARKENFESIKLNIHKLEIKQGYVEQISGTFSKFNLSNIFEYMDESTFKKTMEELHKMGQKNTRYAYWNLMVNRQLHVYDQFQKSSDWSPSTSQLIDKCFFYKSVHLSVKHD